jgi:phage terminase large subunit GpA-like protein
MMQMAKVLRDPRPRPIRTAALAEFESRLSETIAAAFKVEPFLSITDWAQENRYLTGAEAGRYDGNHCPYQRAIQDAFCDPDVREITWQAAERIGKSTVASNVLGYIVDRSPTSVLWVMPSRETVADFLKDEIEPMFRAAPSLWGKVSAGTPSTTGRTSNIRRRTFLNGTMTFVGAGAANPLASRTIKVIVLDEIDKFRVIRGEGDADSLVSKRASTFTDSKILRFSKPTVEGESRIARHYERGSMARYFISCPSCGEFQELGWALLRFSDISLRCSSCNRFFDQDMWLSSPGEWRESVENPHHKSFQCSALVSPLIRWETLIEEFRTAVYALEAGDSSLIQVFENSRLGKVYSGHADRLEPGTLYGRREVFF